MTAIITPITIGTPEHKDYIDYTGIGIVESKASIFDYLQKDTTSPTLGLEYKANIHREHFVDKATRQTYQEDLHQSLGSKIRALLNDIFDRISIANDQTLGMSERSNNFDEWKDMLQMLSRQGEDLTNHHRKILGALISSTKEQDISDFNFPELRLFIDASNVLRQPRLSKQDSKKVVKNVINLGLKPMLHLGIADVNEEEAQELQEMMETLLEKSRLKDDG